MCRLLVVSVVRVTGGALQVVYIVVVAELCGAKPRMYKEMFHISYKLLLCCSC